MALGDRDHRRGDIDAVHACASLARDGYGGPAGSAPELETGRSFVYEACDDRVPPVEHARAEDRINRSL
jgi:hypothetical protein